MKITGETPIQEKKRNHFIFTTVIGGFIFLVPVVILALVSGFDASKAEGLKPVAIQLGSAERIGFEIEKLPDGRSVIFIPSAPSPFSGITPAFQPEQVVYLEVSAKVIIEVTENFGHGMGEVLATRKSSS